MNKKILYALGIAAAAGGLLWYNNRQKALKAATETPEGAQGVNDNGQGINPFGILGNVAEQTINQLGEWFSQSEAKREQNIFNSWYQNNAHKVPGVSQVGWKDFVDKTARPDQLPGLLNQLNAYMQYVANPANFKPGTKKRVIERYQRAARIARDAVARVIAVEQGGQATALRRKNK